MANPSFRVYYGGAPGSVPFTWESEPGTPKHKLSHISLPPLTPPPSYYSNHNTKNHSRKYSRTKFLKTLFLRVKDKKRVGSSPSSLSSSSWSSYATSTFFGRSRFSSMDSSFFEGGDYEEREQVSIGSSHGSMMCFGGGGKGYSIVVMKKTLLAMVGRRSG